MPIPLQLLPAFCYLLAFSNSVPSNKLHSQPSESPSSLQVPLTLLKIAAQAMDLPQVHRSRRATELRHALHQLLGGQTSILGRAKDWAGTTTSGLVWGVAGFF